MRDRYREAQALAMTQRSADVFYPGMNRLAAEMVTAGRGRRQTVPAAEIEAIRESLRDRLASSPDFWSVVGQTELKMYEALLGHTRGGLAAVADELLREFAEHHQRVSAPRLWSSVYDNAAFVLRREMASGAAADRKPAESLLDTLRRFAR